MTARSTHTGMVWSAVVPLGMLTVVSLSVTTFLLTGCVREPTLAQYEKLRVGQSYDEVVQVLGDPAACHESVGLRRCDWGTETRGVGAQFIAGKLLLAEARGLR